MERKRPFFCFMTATVLAFIFLGLLAGNASAELSSNLQQKVIYSTRNKKLVAQRTYVDDEGNPAVASDKGYATIRYSYTTQNQVSMTEFLDEKGNLTNSTDGYAIMRKQYTVKNLVTKTSYFDADNKPATGPDGYSVQETKYLAGKHASTWQYDSNGKPVGIHRLTEYVTVGKIDRIKSDSWYDTEGHLAAGPNGYARVEYAWSGKAKTRVAYIGEDGKPFYYSKDKYATMTAVYKEGKIRETRYYGAEDQPIAGPDGYSYVLYTYPGNGQSRLAMYYNADDTLYYFKEGYCGVQRWLGIRNRVIEKIFYIGEGIKGNIEDGYTRVKYEYNKKGKVVFQKYFDENNKAVMLPTLGYASVTYSYINGKRLEWTVYRDEKGELVRIPDGYAAIKRVYTGQYVTKILYLDTDKKTPAACKDGYATVEYENNAAGQAVKTKYYGIDGKPFVTDQNADEIRNTWEGKNKTSESYWRDGEAVYGKEGYHEARHEYSGGGKVTRTSYFDESGRLMACLKGYASVEYEYNSDSKVMCTRYYDEEGNLVLTPGKEYAYVRTSSFADLRMLGAEIPEGEGTEADGEGEAAEDEEEDPEAESYDEEEEMVIGSHQENAEPEEEESGNGALVEYYGTDGKLMNLEAGYAYIIREMNSSGMVTREAYYDKDGKPVDLKDGYSMIEREYDEKGYLAREAYYDAARKKAVLAAGFHYYTRVNDEAGNPTEIAYFGASGEAVVHAKNKYHRIVRTYLDAKHVSSEAWFDVNDEPMTIGDTYVRIEREYDDNKNNIRVRYYGADGKLIACKAGYDELRQEFNEKKQAIRIRYFLGGEPFTVAGGYAALTREYDEKGNVSFERYYDGEGKAVACNKGYGGIQKRYNDKKQVIYEAWFDPAGVPMGMNGDVYCAIEREYDENGNTNVLRFFDGEGNPTKCNAGYTMVWRRFDEKKRVNYESYMDYSSAPMANVKGVYQTAYDYDDKNRVIQEQYYDADGNPMLCNDGYCRVERKYSKDGKVSDEIHFGLDGETVDLKDAA